MAISSIGAMNNRFIGLSIDTKPTSDVATGATFLEYDTGCLFSYTGSNWFLKTNPDHLFSVTTADLNQAAGDYDLFTAPSSSVQILEFGLIIPDDLTGDAAGSLTAISVQSTDTSPVEFISATQGAKANLTADKHLLYTSAEVVAGTKKIQIAIVGGATLPPRYAICGLNIKRP
jgi:hypothetical protein